MLILGPSLPLSSPMSTAAACPFLPFSYREASHAYVGSNPWVCYLVIIGLAHIWSPSAQLSDSYKPATDYTQPSITSLAIIWHMLIGNLFQNVAWNQNNTLKSDKKNCVDFREAVPPKKSRIWWKSFIKWRPPPPVLLLWNIKLRFFSGDGFP